MAHPPHAVPALVREVAPLLGTRRFGRALEGHGEITSTNTRAAAWAATGAPEGAVVLAERQTAGRGRLGRSWEAGAGLNLTFSIVLRPQLPPDALGLVGLAAALGVAEAVERFVTPHTVRIKWPNDLLLDGRKCCGMLLESSLAAGRADAIPCVVLGIGLNVNQASFPPALADRATSLLLATGHPTPRAPLLAALLERVETYYDRLLDGPRHLLVGHCERRLAGLGETVTFRMTERDEQVCGTIAGLAPTGALLLDTPAGRRVFHAGEVTTQR